MSSKSYNYDGVNIYSEIVDKSNIKAYEAICGKEINNGYSFYSENLNKGYEFDVTNYDKIKIDGVTTYRYSNLFTLFDKYNNIINF